MAGDAGAVSQQRRQLEIYANTDVEVGLPGWTRVAGHDAIPVLPVDELLVITAYNPGDARPTEAQNVQANADLARVLIELGATVMPAIGRERGGEHDEPSWAVTGVSRATVQAIGALVGQKAIFQITRDEQRTHTCDGKQTHVQRRVLRPSSEDAPCTVKVTNGQRSWSVDGHDAAQGTMALDLTEEVQIDGDMLGMGWLLQLPVATPDIDAISPAFDEDSWFEHHVIASDNPGRWRYNDIPLAAAQHPSQDGWCMVPWPENPEVVVEHYASWEGQTPGGGGWARSRALRLADDVALISWRTEDEAAESHGWVGEMTQDALVDAAEAPIFEELYLRPEDDDDPAGPLESLTNAQARQVLELAQYAEDAHGLTHVEFADLVAEMASMSSKDTLMRVARLARPTGDSLVSCLEELGAAADEIDESGLADAIRLAEGLIKVAPPEGDRFHLLRTATRDESLGPWLAATKKWARATTRLDLPAALELTLQALESGEVVDRDQVLEALPKHQASSSRLGFMAGDTEYYCWPDAIGRDEDSLWLDPMAVGSGRRRDGWHLVRRTSDGVYVVELGGPVGEKGGAHTILARPSDSPPGPLERPTTGES